VSAGQKKKATRRIVAVVGLGAVAWSLWLVGSSAWAQGQPPPGAKDVIPTAQPAPPPAGAQPSGLPPGHPPIGKQPGGAQVPPKGRTADQLRELIDRQKGLQGGGKAPEGGGAGEAPKMRYPRDEHGECLHHGAHDPPPDINLLHGWLGVNEEKAPPPPPPRTGAFDWGWWKWRLTPYPWRYDNHEDECDPRNEPVPLIANIINVGALFFLIGRFGRRPLRESLEKRKRGITSEIDRARTIKEGAVERLERYKHDLAHLDDKLAALRQQYLSEGVLEEQRVQREASEALTRMLTDAEFRVTQESKAARETLSREALDDALRAAEALLEKSVTAADHDRLAEEYLEQVGTALGNGGRR
jgi:F-type H+-transporting ATPase subunit b